MAFTGACHCGATRFAVDAPLPAQLTRCTCTFCSKRGALWAYCEPARLTLIEARDERVYRWQSKTVAHHFCGQCGCTTYSDSPAFERDGTWDGHTRRIGINARLIDGFEAAEAPVTVLDGRHLW